MKLSKGLKWSAGLVTIGLIFGFAPKGDEGTSFRTIKIKSTDNVTVTADVYETETHDKDTSPIILLFHQARFSRGEYREIAPKLVSMGYTCIAIDQRSGKEVNGVLNETHEQAEKLGLPTKYVDAYPDLDATFKYTKQQYPNRKVIIWGSSYSSSLAFILAGKYPDEVKGILSFSPGEYFEYHENTIEDYAHEIVCPVFITSAKNEHDAWRKIYEAVPNAKKQFFLPTDKGFHGSKALWKESTGNEAYWTAVTEFLHSIQ